MRPLRLFHFDIPTYGNYGDTLLFEAVRQTFEGFGGRDGFEVYDTRPLRNAVGPRLVDMINAEADAVVLGGGGLFLSDTNPNRRSGWQWNISLDQLRRLEKPLIVFAVGNNRFYGQPDFADPFREHLALTVEKSVFFGLRNQGSVRTIREYLPPSLRDRVVYQPCPTTISSHLFPDLFDTPAPPGRRIAVQSIVGKRQLRAGFDAEAIYAAQARVLAKLAGEGWDVRSVPFSRADLRFGEVLAEHGLDAPETRLFGVRDAMFRGLEVLRESPTFLGTRGHAQMVPFGMGAVPVSLDVHPKTGYFASDLGHPEWALDPRDAEFETTLYRTLHDVDARGDELRAELAGTRERLYRLTLENVAGIHRALRGSTSTPRHVPFTPAERHLALRGFRATADRSASEGALREARAELARAKAEAAPAAPAQPTPLAAPAATSVAARAPKPGPTFLVRAARRAKRTLVR
jgi:hypothetical protein